MSSFPPAASKLGAPTKKSIFERQKAEAEAKKAREKAETAAVYEDFVKSFDDDGEAVPSSVRPSHAPSAGGHTGGPGKRHFTSSGLKSGPGSLGPTQPAYGKKRHFDDFTGRRDRDRDRSHGMFAYNEGPLEKSRESSAFEHGEDHKDAEELKAAAKPTLHLSSLPPATSPAVIKALFDSSPLSVEHVRILHSTNPAAERRSMSAIVTLAAESPATDIDTAVSQLQNRYLGFGFNLSISRHLSSAVLTGAGAVSAPGSGLNSMPFGAKPVAHHTTLSRAPPPGQGSGRFAPPASYTSSTPYGVRSNVQPTQVLVKAPPDLKQLKLIHKTLEALLTYGPEFEALLMSRPEIQNSEQWAWLWNSKSAGGVYYRWRLWEILTNSSARRRRQQIGYVVKPAADLLFEGQSSWVSPEDGLKFEYTTRLAELVSDEDYNSSDEEDEDGGGIARRYNDHNIAGATVQESIVDGNDGVGYLNPLAKAKLVHLLSRLPDTNAKLRKGDVARITGFAIDHAGAGADEIAAIVTRNVLKPFHLNRKDADDHDRGPVSTEKDGEHDEISDNTPASLVGLYVISDLLSSSASAGVRHAWRYRSLFENALRQQQVFQKLGRAEKNLAWGKLKAEKWRRSVLMILSLWEGWCVFPQATQEEFVDSFTNPPLTERERLEAEADEKRKAGEEARKTKSTSKWKSVDEETITGGTTGKLVDDVAMDDITGPASVDDDELGEDELIDESVDGWAMEDSSDEDPAERVGEEGLAGSSQKETVAQPPHESVAQTEPPVLTKRQRMRAVDMFADDPD